MNRGVRASSPIAARRSLTSPVSVVSATKVFGQRTRWRSSFAIASGLRSNQDLEELKSPRRDADGTLRAHELARLRVEDAVTESDAHSFPRKNHRSPTDPPRRRGRCGASVIIAQNVRMDGLRAERRRTCSPHPSRAPRSGLAALAALLLAASLSQAQDTAGSSTAAPHTSSPRAQRDRENGGDRGSSSPGKSPVPADLLRLRRRLGPYAEGEAGRDRPDRPELPGMDLVRRRGVRGAMPRVRRLTPSRAPAARSSASAANASRARSAEGESDSWRRWSSTRSSTRSGSERIRPRARRSRAASSSGAARRWLRASKRHPHRGAEGARVRAAGDRCRSIRWSAAGSGRRSSLESRLAGCSTRHRRARSRSAC